MRLLGLLMGAGVAFGTEATVDTIVVDNEYIYLMETTLSPSLLHGSEIGVIPQQQSSQIQFPKPEKKLPSPVYRP
jgi:hypothetical protein